MNFSVGSSACNIAVSQIQKRDELVVELYINENKELFHSLLQNKEEIESVTGFSLDWRELPDKKASRILVTHSAELANQSMWCEQFDWLVNVMLKMKTSFKKYL